MRNPPIALYVHFPWCVQKCPYCDFNSHTLRNALPEHAYIQHLLDDLNEDAIWLKDREISSIFIGGGTPSLISADGIASLLHGVRQRVALSANAEITLEANPGAAEAQRFLGYVQAGVNRISIGVQSFQAVHLQHLGRIHSQHEAVAAVDFARQAGLSQFNLDLMHGLPEQTVSNALDDLTSAIALSPPHLSWYQLTIEPNTPFYSKPPQLPDDDILWEIQTAGDTLLAQAGYLQYEISAYAKEGMQCQHNLNYWRYGDYLGIGCGAHGKITLADEGRIIRTVKTKHPRGYMDLTRTYRDSLTSVALEDRPFEFFMNYFRLLEPCPKEDFTAFTGCQFDAALAAHFKRFEDQSLLIDGPDSWSLTAKGRRYLNSILAALA